VKTLLGDLITHLPILYILPKLTKNSQHVSKLWHMAGLSGTLCTFL